MRMSQGGREPHPKDLLQNTGTLQGSQKGKAAGLYQTPQDRLKSSELTRQNPTEHLP
jgi:hypothetical protein